MFGVKNVHLTPVVRAMRRTSGLRPSRNGMLTVIGRGSFVVCFCRLSAQLVVYKCIFTSIPVEESIQVCEEKLIVDYTLSERTQLDAPTIIQLRFERSRLGRHSSEEIQTH